MFTEIINQYKNMIFSNKVYFYPNIPADKLDNALKSYIQEDVEIFVLIDDTVFGSAKEGMALSKNAIYAKEQFQNKKKCDFEYLNLISLKKGFINNKILINESDFIDLTQIEKKYLELLIKMIDDLSKTFSSLSSSSMGTQTEVQIKT